MSALQLYLIIKLSSTITMFGLITTGLITSIFICFISYMIAKSDNDKSEMFWKNTLLKMLKYCLPISIVTLLLAVYLPSTKEAAIIYVLPKIINNSGIQAIPDKIINLSNEWLDELHPDNVLNKAESIKDTL